MEMTKENSVESESYIIYRERSHKGVCRVINKFVIQELESETCSSFVF